MDGRARFRNRSLEGTSRTRRGLKPVAGLALQSERFDNGESFGKIIFSKDYLQQDCLE
jgi:hypothetical protein